MQILRYTEDVQRQIGSKTKPEPWMHVAIIQRGKQGEHGHVSYLFRPFAIYVWDTRQVIEQGVDTRGVQITGQRANDSRAALVDLHGKYAEDINGEVVKASKRGTANDDLKQQIDKLWQEFCNARDKFFHNIDFKSDSESEASHKAAERTLAKMIRFGVKHDIKQWSQYDGRALRTVDLHQVKPADL